MLILGALLMPVVTFAQMDQQLPVDPAVRIGQLPNGLTYYIRHNEYPKGQADFYIAQKVGSILEEDNQRGLAHFLEHMCFNGTTHFPDKDIINWLESVGVKFGANLNAYTGVDETVYNISAVPIARESVQDSCLLILHDWANDLTLAPEEIDAERAVIHEEWRRSNVGQMRILESLLPTIYPNSRYGYRLPIGTMEVVDNFEPQALRDYYEKWYRPDQQAIIVVGDIDVDRIEGKIKEMFADIEMPENAAERIYYPVEDTEGTIYAIGKDKEQNFAIAELMFKTDAIPDELKNTMAYYAQDYIMSMITSMLNTRLSDITARPDAPFASADAGYGQFFLATTKDAFTISALDKNNDLPDALAAAYRELLRAQRGGFTVSEYERASAEYLSRMEKAYNNRNQHETEAYSREYVKAFTEKEPIPGIEIEYQIAQMLVPNIPVEAINSILPQMITADNRVLLALLPDKEGVNIPTEADFANALAAIEAEDIEPYKEEVKSEPLIPQLPTPGTITSTQELTQWGATEWTLSNGARVIVKPTKFKDDEILFNAIAFNGTSEVPADKVNSLTFLDYAIGDYGLGSYTNSDLKKYLSGKQVRLSPDFSSYSREFTGSTTPKDLPTLMELIYMAFTDLEVTPDEFEATQNTYRSILKNQESNPQYIFQTKLSEALYGNSPLVKNLSTEVVDNAKLDEILSIAHSMTTNAAEFVFIFVGNVDIDALRPLVEQYIATLPGDQATARKQLVAFNPDLTMKGGKTLDTFTAAMETPQTWCCVLEWGDMPYTPENRLLSTVSAQILSKRLNDIVREKEGAVYSIGAYGAMRRNSSNPIMIQVPFPMKPEMKEKVLGIIEEQFGNLTSDITEEELAKVKEYMVKDYTEGLEQNGSWLGWIGGWSLNGVDTMNGGLELINALTVPQVENFMKQLNGQDNYRVVILDPAE